MFDPRERNRFDRTGRLLAAVRELSGVHGVATLGCACKATPVKGLNLRGYQAVKLSGAIRLKGRGLGAAPPHGTAALIPVSDRSAIIAAIRRFQQR